jgi:sterol desaturase/sphingolipid hydroxylase (fatty acid hydroxylase superfamily)
MALLSLEHSPAGYRADVALYAVAIAGLAGLMVWAAPRPEALALGAWVLAGGAMWSAIEYLLHRFVLHGVQPFRRWHALHHARPMALIGTPTWVSALLFGALAFLPGWLWLGRWPACALTLGLLLGYLGYTVAHHAVHHWRMQAGWLQRLKHNHALHHHGAQACCYGVSTGFWDTVMGTAQQRPRPGRRPAP